jgi:hypothetical protein
VHINDVFFSDADDDAVIEAVERELRLKRATAEEVFESSNESSNELDMVQELPEEVSNQKFEQPNNFIDLKPKRSLIEFLKSETKVQPKTVLNQNQPVVENDIFESPRSEEAPDLQIGEGEFNSEAYERAYHAVSLQRKLEEKRRLANDLSSLPGLHDYEELMRAEKQAHP